MFGHQDNDDNPQHDNATPAEPAEPPQTPAPDNATDQPSEQPAQDDSQGQAAEVVQPETPATPEVDGTNNDAPQEDSQNPEPNASWQHPGAPTDATQEPISDVISPAGGFPKRPSYQYPSAADKPELPALSDTAKDDPVVHELLDVKDHALEELAPLLDKLDLPPEEKFRAIMMIIQSSDDKNLVKTAYATAHAIEDDEIRARALYTIVNEVDYFTHPQNDSQPNE